MQIRATFALSWHAARWLAFYGLVLAAWGAFYQMARGDGGILCGPDAVRLLPFGGFWVYFPMWAVMMAAMMLPTLVPALRAYGDLPVRAGATTAGWFAIIGGYLAVWLVGAAGFAAAQAALIDGGLVDLSGVLVSPWASAGLLAVAGAYQLSRTKEACQNVCLTPTQYYITRWRPGVGGALRMGAGLGAWCVGCCWAIMALGFVGGVMSLLWMGLATAFMVMEKLPGLGEPLRRPAGWALLAAAAGFALRGAGLV